VMEGSGEPPMKLADRGDLLSRETKGDEGGEVGIKMAMEPRSPIPRGEFSY
jgi:hypothetical protein